MGKPARPNWFWDRMLQCGRIYAGCNWGKLKPSSLTPIFRLRDFGEDARREKSHLVAIDASCNTRIDHAPECGPGDLG